MTMTVALGISTPTSMTVVATRTSISPLRKAAMAASLSLPGICPWSRPQRNPCRTSPERRSNSSVADRAWMRSDSSMRGQTT